MKSKKQFGMSVAIFSCVLIGMSLGFTDAVKSEIIQKTILNEGFESGIPSTWTNTGWLRGSLYQGSAHTGNEWVYSWASGDELTTPSLKFGENTELSFWYCAESASNPMTLEVYIDDTQSADLLWSDTNFMYSTYQQATINLSAYTGMHKIIFVGKTSDLFGQLLDDIVITSYLDKDDSGNTIGGDNTPPVADLSKGEPYTGQVNQDITFDGSNSYDPDGTIVKWWWEFGDGNSSTGEIVTYQYSHPGTYTVTLQVLDDANANATDTATVTIVQGENGPPDAPLVKADKLLPLELNVFELTDPDRSITLFIQANDKDDDMVYFVIDWDDGFSDTTSAVASNAKVTVNHTWVKQGLYKISIIAKDTYDTSSQPTIVTVFLNMYVKKLPTIAGYLVGYTTDGNYSEFYNSNSHNITDMPTDTMDRYLIDYNGDGTPDYTYDDSSGVVAYESEGDQQQDTSTKTPGFEFLIVLSSVLLFIIVRRKRT